MFFFYLHYESITQFSKEYLWVAPLVFFKSILKKLLVLNFFGVIQLLLTIVLHALKLLLIKFLKTIGIRYGTYFSQQKWQKTSQRLRIFSKVISNRVRRFQKLIRSLNKIEFTIVLIAFLPLFILMFLFGIGFRMTRDVMVKKGSEIGVTNVAVKTAKKSRGLIARLKQADAWLLQKIKLLTNDKC
ncbi:MAG: hypothetical protein KGV50_00690 [Gammaproteobacteria bacterium]|nr:hypothetical protein [Gammaproteobacteria bacterium]